jgi:phosphohistidine phosphatase SixA
MLLVRHASAGDREAWEGDDRERPLDDKGREQADALVDQLASHRIERILSSPAVRCVQTVEPLAAARGLQLELREELSEEEQATAGAALLRSLAGDDVVVCGHGGLEQAVPGAPKWKKGATLVLGPQLEVLETLR